MNSSQNRRPLGSSGRRTVLACLAGLAGVTAFATPALASDGPAEPPAKLQRALDDVVAAGAPGALVEVRDGGRMYRLTSGLGDLARKAPVRVADRSRIGGLTKSFTATVVLQLAGEGRLTLDDTVERWLPGRIPNGGAISIRQLLNHTSGIFSFDKDPSVLAPYRRDLTRVFDLDQGVKLAAAHGPLFAPGSRLSYSNTNYVLLGMIVEAATGNPIGSELRSRIFEPLHLRHTTYPSSSRIPGTHLHGYLPGPSPVDVTPLSPTIFGASAAIVSNAGDLTRFYRALLRGRLLRPEQLQAMKTIDPVATGGVPDSGIRGGGWGLGLIRERFPCGTAWGHDSEIPGYTTAAWSSPGGTRQVVVLVNTLFSPDAPAARALRRVLARAYCGS